MSGVLKGRERSEGKWETDGGLAGAPQTCVGSMFEAGRAAVEVVQKGRSLNDTNLRAFTAQTEIDFLHDGIAVQVPIYCVGDSVVVCFSHIVAGGCSHRIPHSLLILPLIGDLGLSQGWCCCIVAWSSYCSSLLILHTLWNKFFQANSTQISSLFPSL